MKKIIALFLAGLLVFSMVACTTDNNDEPSTNAQPTDTHDVIQSYCYVLCVLSDGFVASINDIGNVFIKYNNRNDEIEVFDTVVIEYDRKDLLEAIGHFEIAGEQETYSYRLNNPKTVRKADPSKGEPVFG